ESASRTHSVGSAPFVGRKTELEALHASYAKSRKRCQLALVRGPSGIGKTALVREFLDSLPDEPLVLQGRCYEQESVPYKALDGVVDDLTRHLRRLDSQRVAETLPADFAVLGRVFPVLREIGAFAKAGDVPFDNP